MEYKAKPSYQSAKVNFLHFADIGKHERLLAGEAVEITSPPKEIEKHLEKVGEEDGARD